MKQYTLPTPYPVGDVHFYHEEINGKSVLFDCGPPTKDAIDFFRNKFPSNDVRYVIFTHTHQDHFGMAYWFAENTSARLLVPRLDAIKMQSDIKRLDFMKQYIRSLGFSKNQVELMLGAIIALKKDFFLPNHFEIMEETLESTGLPIRAIGCPGHSQTDYIYIVNGYAVCGDAVLPGIFQTPLLDLDLEKMEGAYDNYTNYCKSIEQIWLLAEYKFLPGHNNVVNNPLEVIAEYVSRILLRSGTVARIGVEKNVSEILFSLYPDAISNPFKAYIKISEIAFFKNFLSNPNLLKNILLKVGIFNLVQNSWKELFSGKM